MEKVKRKKLKRHKKFLTFSCLLFFFACFLSSAILTIFLLFYIYPATPEQAALIRWEQLVLPPTSDYISVFEELKNVMKKHGMTFRLKNRPKLTDNLIFVARADYHVPSHIKAPAYLWNVESPITIRFPAIKKDEERYSKIFTYSKRFTDNKKYFYAPVPFRYDNAFPYCPNPARKTVLVSQIAGLYKYGKKNELYFLRQKSTEWYVRNHPEDYFLYGKDWKDFKKTLSSKEQEAFDRVYHGYIPRKSDAVIKAKFILAYENGIFDGYVSEKIFDVMAYGAVPVYIGAPDIKNYVPENCFIDKNKFQTEEALYNYLKNMTDEQYYDYLICGSEYMSRPVHYNDPLTVFHLLEKELFAPREIFHRFFQKIEHLFFV